MSALTYLNNFPMETRGTYRIKEQEDLSESQVLVLAKRLVLGIAKDNKITILLHCGFEGNGWLLVWWPSNEPRHQASDEIIIWREEEDGE